MDEQSLQDSITEFFKVTGAEYRQSITLDSMSHKQNFKGPEMAKTNENLEIEIKVNGETVKAGGKAAKVKTDLEMYKKHKVFAVFFDQKGKQVHAETFKSKSDATQKLATPEFIGCSVMVYNQGTVSRQKLQLEEV